MVPYFGTVMSPGEGLGHRMNLVKAKHIPTPKIIDQWDLGAITSWVWESRRAQDMWQLRFYEFFFLPH